MAMSIKKKTEWLEDRGCEIEKDDGVWMITSPEGDELSSDQSRKDDAIEEAYENYRNSVTEIKVGYLVAAGFAHTDLGGSHRFAETEEGGMVASEMSDYDEAVDEAYKNVREVAGEDPDELPEDDGDGQMELPMRDAGRVRAGMEFSRSLGLGGTDCPECRYRPDEKTVLLLSVVKDGVERPVLRVSATGAITNYMGIPVGNNPVELAEALKVWVNHETATFMQPLRPEGGGFL